METNLTTQPVPVVWNRVIAGLYRSVEANRMYCQIENLDGAEEEMRDIYGNGWMLVLFVGYTQDFVSMFDTLTEAKTAAAELMRDLATQ